MSLSFTEFIQELSNLPFLITVLLTLGVILVNGWTDAPNAIATAVSTRALSPKLAIIMAAIFNFLGVFVMTLFFTFGVAKQLYQFREWKRKKKNRKLNPERKKTSSTMKIKGWIRHCSSIF